MTPNVQCHFSQHPKGIHFYYHANFIPFKIVLNSLSHTHYSNTIWHFNFTTQKHTVFGETFQQALFSYSSNNQQSNENKTYSKFSHVIAKFDTWSLAVNLLLDRYGVASFLGPHCFFKPVKVNCQLNLGLVRDADKAVELRLNTKPSPKCRGEVCRGMLS